MSEAYPWRREFCGPNPARRPKRCCVADGAHSVDGDRLDVAAELLNWVALEADDSLAAVVSMRRMNQPDRAAGAGMDGDRSRALLIARRIGSQGVDRGLSIRCILLPQATGTIGQEDPGRGNPPANRRARRCRVLR